MEDCWEISFIDIDRIENFSIRVNIRKTKQSIDKLKMPAKRF